MLIAALGFTGMQVFVKQLSGFHVLQVVFFRSAITAGLCMTYLKIINVSFIGSNQKLLFQRAFFGIISMTLFFITVQRMPLGASVSIKYLSPIFTAIFAVILLKEKVKPIQWFFFFTALMGVLLLKGFDSRIDTFTLILGIIGAITGGLVYVTIRKIGESENPLVIINYFMFSATILSGIGMIPYWQSPTDYEWFCLIAVGSCGYIGQIYMTRAFQIESASRLAPIKYMELIYSILIGLIIFGESYSFWGWIGMSVILISMILSVITKSKHQRTSPKAYSV